MPGQPRYLANCSLLFTEHSVFERPAAAEAAGFDAIEFWWPFADAVPTDAEVDGFVAAVDNAGVQLVGLNFFAGDLFGPDCGVLSLPGRAREFTDNVQVAIGIGRRLGVGAFNALYGNRIAGVYPHEQDELATANLVLAADAARAIGATVLIESVSGPKPYPLRTAADSLAVLDRVQAAGADNVGFLCDLFHLAGNGDDIDAVIADDTARIAHVQIADAPGRGEPGTGSLPLERYVSDLQSNGYGGWIGLEYKPTTDTVTSLDWLPRERRSAPG